MPRKPSQGTRQRRSPKRESPPARKAADELAELITRLPGLEESGWEKLVYRKAAGKTEIFVARGPRERPKIVILFLGANPSDETRLALTKEVKKISNMLLTTRQRDRFRLEQEWEVEAGEVPGLIMQHEPQILHFSGHGSKTGALIFQNAAGRAQAASRRAIGGIFGILPGLRCVLLNACYSKTQAKEIAKHIDAVIGMTQAIEDTSAIAFAGAFYQALGFGKSIHDAFGLAKIALDLHGLPGARMAKLIPRPGIDPKHVTFA